MPEILLDNDSTILWLQLLLARSGWLTGFSDWLKQCHIPEMF